MRPWMRSGMMWVTGACACLVLMSHEFWLQPERFVIAPGDSLTVNFKVGQNFLGEAWKAPATRFARLELHSGARKEDLVASLAPGENGLVRLAVPDAGTHLVVLQSTHAFVEMEAAEFNAYLQEDGLDDIYSLRKRTHALDQKAREKYARYAKLLLQAGTKTDDTYRKVTGLPLEIVPLRNPYALKVGDRMRFRLLFKGKPLFGAKAKVWNQHNRQTSVQNIYSQQDGTIETTLSQGGTWMVSVVHMVPVTDGSTDWESFWGTLTFGTK